MSTPFDPFDGLEIEPVDHGQMNAATDAVLSDDAEFPDIDPPADTFVDLPGGLFLEKDGVGVLVTTAEVRELTGEDEEIIAKAAKSRNLLSYVRALLRQGLVRLGADEITDSVLDKLLMGDRDAILVGISRATFGEKLEYKEFRCPFCEENIDVEYELDDIPIRELKDRNQRRHEVPLRNGRTATVRMPNLADETKIYADPNLTGPERDTLFLANVVLSISKEGEETLHVQGKKELVKQLAIRDRKALLEYIGKTMPGPRYDEVKFVHEDCGNEVHLPVTVDALFPEL